jgi:hypothetical protein
MRNFEKTIYPVTPYCEYLATDYLIDKNKEALTDDDVQALCHRHRRHSKQV